MRRRKPDVRECRKRYDARCFWHAECGEWDYDALQSHRILEGCNGGRYVWTNLLTLCASHHALVTAGVLRVFRRYPSANGFVVHWADRDGVEHYTTEGEVRR